MKTAVSLPDDLFKKAEKASKRAKMPRSRFYAKAIAAYSDLLLTEDITETLNEIYAQEASGLDPALLQMQIRSIGKESW